MRIKFSPQRNDNVIVYSFSNDSVTAEYNGQTDQFDFTGLPEGAIDNIETTLDVQPVISAVRDEYGELWVELLMFHGDDASEDERFPEWRIY